MGTKLTSLFLLTLLILLAACSAPSPAAEQPTVAPTAAPTTEPTVIKASELTVFAAASLTNAFTEIGKNFEAAHPGVTVQFNFGGSQALRTQLEQGASADVFASANDTEMKAAIAASRVVSGSQQTFLTNLLVVLLPANNPAGVTTLDDLAQPGLKLVLAAEEVPVGRYARQVLQKLDVAAGGGYSDKVLANVVSNEDNVRQVVAKVQLGEADAGIVYASDAVASPTLKTLAIPAESNVVAKYPIAVIQDSPSPDLAQQFVALVLSPAGQAILKKWGFAPVGPTS